MKARVEKMAQPVIWAGEKMWWSYQVPTGPTVMVGWRGTQREAIREACEILRERHERANKK